MPRRRTTPVPQADTSPTKTIAGFSLEALSEKLAPYIDGSIKTLGEAALEGDKVAAKTVLEFLTEIARENTGSRSNEVLAQIAKIRERAS